MVTIILTVFTVLQVLAQVKNWRHSGGELSSFRWQAAIYALILVAFAILLFVDFGMQVDRLPTDTPAEALAAIKLQHQRVAYSVVALMFAAAGYAVCVLKIRRKGGQSLFAPLS